MGALKRSVRLKEKMDQIYIPGKTTNSANHKRDSIDIEHFLNEGAPPGGMQNNAKPLYPLSPHASGEGGGGYSFVACLSYLTIDHASLSRWSTVPTPSRHTSIIWALITLFPYMT